MLADPEPLRRIQSRTLSLLRSEISPVSRLDYAAHVMGLNGITDQADAIPTTVADVLHRLRGYAAPSSDWSRSIIPTRTNDSISELEDAISGGDFTWAIDSAGSDTRMVRIFPKGQGRIFLSDDLLARIDGGTAEDLLRGSPVADFLRREGVASSSEIRSAFPDASVFELRSQVRDLVLAGMLTCNSWSALTGILREMDPVSSPTARPIAPPTGHRSQVRETRRRAGQAIKEASVSLPPNVIWTPTLRHAFLGPEVTAADRAQGRANALLDRYGVVTRFVFETEGRGWDWGVMARELSLMELRGAVRRGYFVEGLPGVQFASPEAVDALRGGFARGFGLLSAKDPANVLDPDSLAQTESRRGKGWRFSRIGSTWIGFAGPAPIILIEGNGRNIHTSEDASDEANATGSELRAHVLEGITEFVQRTMTGASMSRRIEVGSWNGQPILKSDGVEILEDAGFRKEYPSMVFDALQSRVLAGRGN